MDCVLLSGCDLILCLMRALLCLLFSASILSAQTSAPGSSANSSKAQSKPDLSQEAAIIEQLDTILSYEADGTGKSDNSSRIRLQSSAGAPRAGWGTLYLEVQCKHQNGNRANPRPFIYGAKLTLPVQFKSDRFPL